MVVVSHLFFFFQINFREGMTRCESYPPCFGTIYFPTAPVPGFIIYTHVCMFSGLFFLFAIVFCRGIHPVNQMLDHHFFYINIKA